MTDKASDVGAGTNLDAFANYTYEFGNYSVYHSNLRNEVDRIMDAWHLGLVVVGSLDCIAGLALNVFLLVTVLTSRAMRSDVRNLLIVNLAVADLLVDAFCQPLQVDEALREGWVKGCNLHIAVQLIDICASAFVSVWGIACLDLLLLLRMTRLSNRLTSFLTSSLTTSTWLWRRRAGRGLKVAAVLIPWVFSAVVIAPLVLTGINPLVINTFWTEERCHLVIRPTTYRVLATLVFFLPCAVILLLLLLTAVVFCKRRRSGRGVSLASPPTPQTISTLESPSRSQPEDPSAGQPDPASAYVTASVLTLVLTGAVHVYKVGAFARSLSIAEHFMLYLSLIALSTFKSTALPVVWLLMLPDVKARARHLLTSVRHTLRRVNTVPSALSPSVAYSNLQHHDQEQ
ncbi:hypothetical protein BaRGS_00009038 [Batillaria attramentaria]|uniref:G-protein coupled receptors family 1 profile domain-containing protein n=1 Tax=Batillaria attramentaria TaxID=370345 RepID=A0ABD0LJK0_9CAEN